MRLCTNLLCVSPLYNAPNCHAVYRTNRDRRETTTTVTSTTMATGIRIGSRGTPKPTLVVTTTYLVPCERTLRTLPQLMGRGLEELPLPPEIKQEA